MLTPEAQHTSGLLQQDHHIAIIAKIIEVTAHSAGAFHLS